MSVSLSDRQKQLRDDFIDARGYWNEVWASLLELDPDFFQAYTEFSSVPWRSGPLEPPRVPPPTRPLGAPLSGGL